MHPRPSSSKPRAREKQPASVKAQTDLRSRFATILDELRGAGAPWPGAVAVSGGGDSLAMLHMLKDWARAKHLPPPLALIVNHGLREDSAAHARKARSWAKDLGLPAHVLTVQDKLPSSDVEAAARDARYRLMGSWLARAHQRALCRPHAR